MHRTKIKSSTVVGDRFGRCSSFLVPLGGLSTAASRERVRFERTGASVVRNTENVWAYARRVISRGRPTIARSFSRPV